MEDSQSMLCPDLMAACCVYFVLAEYGQRTIMLVSLVFDLLCYGPMGLAMSFSLLIYYKVLRKV